MTVSFPRDRRASEVFYEVLSEAREAHPEAFAGMRWPQRARAFKARYARALLAFEAHRLRAPNRVAIARELVEGAARRFVFAADGRETPLAAHLAASTAEPLETESLDLHGSPGLVPELSFRGKDYRGREVGRLADAWLEHRWMTHAAHRAIHWTLDAALRSASGRADLTGHKCVALGAGAELSPTRAMLRAGADVLYLDRNEPPAALRDDPRLSGRLTFVPGGADLLAQPAAIARTIEAFAGGDGVHLGLYAYSGGAAQEWRLTAAMNAIARSLPAGAVRSVVLLISPTTPGAVSAADAAAAERRARALLRRPLGLGRRIRAAGQSGDLPHRVSHSIVSLQGASYQAAQYLGKMMQAEALVGDGLAGAPIAVSAPVAPITKTASLSHPLFDAGFEGAELFGILVSEPQATRVLCALLAFHDLLRPDAPSHPASELLPAERARALLAEQIHGGVYAQPYALEREIGVAALAGLARRPALVPPALRYLVGR